MIELIKNRHYQYITDKQYIAPIAEKFLKDSSVDVIGVDVETNNTLDPREGFLRLVQVSNGRKTFLIDLKECYPDYWDGADLKNEPEILQLKKLLENSVIVKILQNAVFDYKWLYHHLGISLQNIFDTMIADILINYDERHNLAAIAKRKINLDLDKTEQNTDWSGYLEDRKLEYAAFDVHFMPQLYRQLRRELIDHRLAPTAKLEFECIPAMAHLELNGIKCNREIYEKKIKLIDELREKSHDALQKEFAGDGEEIVEQGSLFAAVKPKKSSTLLVTSHSQVRKALQKKGIPIIDRDWPAVQELFKAKTTNRDIPKEDVEKWEQICVEEIQARFRQAGKKYAEGTGSKTLQPLLYDYPVLSALLNFRGADKLQSSYGESFLEHLKPFADHERVYPSYRQIGAPTGRMSCRNPNMQQSPNTKVEIDGVKHEIKLREAFDYPKGKRAVNCDFSQIELRVLANNSNDPAMLDAFRTGKDLHSVTGAGMLKMTYYEFAKALKDPDHPQHDEVSQVRNVTAKRVNFGVVYGIGAKGLAVQLECTEEEAQRHIDSYARSYPVAWDHLHHQGRIALNNLAIRTNLGRRQLFNPPEEDYQQGAIKRNGMNMPIQGTAADIMKLALTKVHNAIQSIPEAKIVSVVHDELTVECKAEDTEKISAILEKEMVEAGEEFLKRVPTVAEPKVIDNWAEAK